jgi:phosphate:Na+ symporter
MTDFLIVGGVALTIFGARFLRKGLDRLFGNRMLERLASSGEKPLQAVAGGVMAGLMVPSSTGLSLASLHLASAHKIKIRQILLILLSAHVGTTLTVQLLAFNLQGLAGLFLFVGLVMFQFLKREFLRGIGQCLLSLGFIFLAMRMIGEGARATAGHPEVWQILGILNGHPLLIAVLAMILAVLLQSSTATLGLLLAWMASGVAEGAFVLPWVIGANIGISITTLMIGWGSADGRRIGFGALSVKLALALPLLFLPALASILFEATPGDLARRAAMLHTAFNAAAVLMALAMGSWIERWTFFLVPASADTDNHREDALLDEALLETPALALSRASRQTLRLADHVRQMFESFWVAYQRRDASLAIKLQSEDDTVDRMNLHISDYLSRISSDRKPDEARWQITLLSFCNELESVGDIIDKNLCDLLLKMKAGGVCFAPEDSSSLGEAYAVVLHRFEGVCGLLASRNRQDARALIVGKDALNEWFREIQQSHYARMSCSTCPDANASAFYLDLLTALRRANSHLTAIAHSLAGAGERKSRKAPVKNL